MSAFEPDTATSGGGTDSTRPRFQLARRGYDRQQVDRYVMELIALIEQQHQRAEHAERMLEQTRSEMDDRGEQQTPSFVHLGVEAGKVLEQAGASAEAIITEAKSRGRSVIEDAEGQAAEVVQEAEQRAGELEQAARDTLEDAESRRDTMLREADQAASETRGQADEEARTVLAEARDATNLVWQEAQQERSLVEAETTRLQAFRQDMLEHLTDVQARLSELLADARGLAEPAPVAEPQPVQDELFATEEPEAGEATAAMPPAAEAEVEVEGAAERTSPMRPAERARTRSR
jgi:cell division septum initiation protein DivIVA